MLVLPGHQRMPKPAVDHAHRYPGTGPCGARPSRSSNSMRLPRPTEDRDGLVHASAPHAGIVRFRAPGDVHQLPPWRAGARQARDEGRRCTHGEGGRGREARPRRHRTRHRDDRRRADPHAQCRRARARRRPGSRTSARVAPRRCRRSTTPGSSADANRNPCAGCAWTAVRRSRAIGRTGPPL